MQLIQSELSSLPQWSHYLPDDIDTNNDGELSEEEVGDKIKSYMSEVFNQLDKDSNQVVIQDEVKNASLDVNFLNKIIDIAFKSYPVKMYLGHGDRNQDGFISEDDFYLAGFYISITIIMYIDWFHKLFSGNFCINLL